MKKFVVIMISALVLFTFLMLNYLVWDKENLQKQRETDKIEQDWLRGQNRILTTTVEDLEQANSKLEKETKDQKEKINVLESQMQLSQQREVNNQVQIGKQSEYLYLYKNLLGESIRATVENWFSLINQKRHQESFDLLAENYTIHGKKYDKDSYIEVISAIDSITIAEKSEDISNEPFSIIENAEPEVIQAQVVVNAYIIDSKQESLPDFVDGINLLEFSLIYNHTSKNWVILSVITKNSGNP